MSEFTKNENCLSKRNARFRKKEKRWARHENSLFHSGKNCKRPCKWFTDSLFLPIAFSSSLFMGYSRCFAHTHPTFYTLVPRTTMLLDSFIIAIMQYSIMCFNCYNFCRGSLVINLLLNFLMLDEHLVHSHHRIQHCTIYIVHELHAKFFFNDEMSALFCALYSAHKLIYWKDIRGDCSFECGKTRPELKDWNEWNRTAERKLSIPKKSRK